MSNCADCGGFDIEWMRRCPKHKGVEFCRGCECPYCAEESFEDYDEDEISEYDATQAGDIDI